MTYDALRIGRVSIPGQVYFITMVTAGRRTLFADFGLARVVIREMRRLDDDGWVESMAWVVMKRHLRLRQGSCRQSPVLWSRHGPCPGLVCCQLTIISLC